jgi:hypothetical protein
LQASVGELFEILGSLLRRAQHDGAVPGDIHTDDLPALLRGCQVMESGQLGASGSGVLTSVVVDGLRAQRRADQ